MSHPFTLPVMGASLLLSVAAGIHLGETTIGLVSPHFLQGPAVHPRDRGVAIDENRLPQRGQAYAGLYGWEQGFDALAAHCVECEALTASDAYAYSAIVPYFGSSEENRGTVKDGLADPYAKVVVPPGEEESPDTDERVLRYAHYPVEPESGMGGPDPYGEEGLAPDQE